MHVRVNEWAMGSTHELYIIIIECHMNTIYIIIIEC